jgi:hypothetical protein
MIPVQEPGKSRKPDQIKYQNIPFFRRVNGLIRQGNGMAQGSQPAGKSPDSPGSSGTRPAGSGTGTAGGSTPWVKITVLIYAFIIAFLGSIACAIPTGLFLSAVLPQGISRFFLGLALYGLFFVVLFIFFARKFWNQPPDLDGYSYIGEGND